MPIAFRREFRQRDGVFLGIHRLLLGVGGAVLLPALASATEIKLKSGQIYHEVKILSQDERSVLVQLPFGTARLARPTIQSIDGVELTPKPKPALAVKPAATLPAPSTAEAVAEIPGIAAPGEKPAPPPAESISPAPTPLPVADVFSDAKPWPDVAYRPNMDALIFAIALAGALWVMSINGVQRDLYVRRRDPRFWTLIALLLPGMGVLLYRVARSFSLTRERKVAARNPNEIVAEREKKRGRAGQRARRGFEFLDEERQTVLVKNDGEISGIENAQDVLEEALIERASDIHIEPAEGGYGVRFRIDGVMHARMSFDRDAGQRVVSALKVLAQIDVAERRKAQDGRFRVRAGEADVDFRVATANSIFGEKLVIRILDHHTGVLTLEQLGMPLEMRDQLARVIRSRNGMILATGPTGSGKTSTLYSALSQLDAKRLNIMTIEDPVEYELAGATQMPVNVKAGITYESGLRSLLRQDPDVIFVGEMRDIEAAQIALRAALTGHLVFSSLHTRDAVGTVIRLEEMGIERHLLSSSLLVLMAQRLVRVLCPQCREAYASTAHELEEIGIEIPDGETIYRAKGCDECNDTGYLGRTGIFEMLVFDEALRQGVNQGVGEGELAKIARERGYKTFRENGAEKVLMGITSVDEVLQTA